MRKKTILIILGIVLSLVWVGCNSSDLKDKEMDMIIYSYDMERGELIARGIASGTSGKQTNESLAKAVLDAMVSQKDGAGLANVDLGELEPSLVLREQTAFVIFNEGYEMLDVLQQSVVRATIIYSLTEIDGIDNVEFFVEDSPITNTRGERLGPLNRSHVVLNGINPNPPTNRQTITLYFTKEGTGKLYPETREIEVNNNTPIENYIIQELIKGPVSEDLIATLPADTKLNDLKTRENVVQVDLSYSLQSKEVATPLGETLLVYSIVNSLTEVSYIKTVTFVSDGNSNVNFNMLFERDETFFETD